ncbi:MAG: ATP-binding protein [Candidatus Riflebacteria bacterium]|nr:ATP-binding protein [Candidatus Riflebacteria bacterium]
MKIKPNIHENILEVSIENRPGEIGICSKEITKFLELRKTDPDTIYRFVLSIEEIVSNIIKYAYSDCDKHEIELVVEIMKDQVVISFTDDGFPFDPRNAPQPDTNLEIEKQPIGGLGIFLVKNMMTDILYKRLNGKNILKLSFGRFL